MALSMTYNAVHHRIRKVRGRARDHLCVDCGAPAEQWAYDRQDPDEMPGVTSAGKPVTYSTKIEHYQPRCLSCHRALDKPASCPKGHPLTEKSTYLRGNGERMCKTCASIRNRTYYAAKKVKASAGH